ncbi:unnamed protein product [Protopolystoma xenopodis]|uniref:PAC domain-containing protein n=1 Tax=Protopolystoma xenopodis TaxID=117903 RepID=A0A3S5CQ57_9PLAT|nr:unnamed protein product [Protopolystoma xenopodis]
MLLVCQPIFLPESGSMLWLVIYVAPIWNADGEAPLYLILLHDITAVRQPVDEELLRSGESPYLIFALTK